MLSHNISLSIATNNVAFDLAYILIKRSWPVELTHTLEFKNIEQLHYLVLIILLVMLEIWYELLCFFVAFDLFAQSCLLMGAFGIISMSSCSSLPSNFFNDWKLFCYSGWLSWGNCSATPIEAEKALENCVWSKWCQVSG